MVPSYPTSLDNDVWQTAAPYLEGTATTPPDANAVQCLWAVEGFALAQSPAPAAKAPPMPPADAGAFAKHMASGGSRPHAFNWIGLLQIVVKILAGLGTATQAP